MKTTTATILLSTVALAAIVVLTVSTTSTDAPDVITPSDPGAGAPPVLVDDETPLAVESTTAAPLPEGDAPTTDEPWTVEIRAVANAFGGPPPDVAGLTVDYGVRHGRDAAGEPLGSFVLDETGRATIELPWDLARPDGEDRRAYVWARVSGAGFLTSSRSARAASEPGGHVDVKLTATQGVLVRGRVLDAHGEPAAARIEALTTTDDGVSSTLAGTTADGAFELPLKREGETRLFAAATSGGADALRAFSGVYDLGTGISDPFVVDFMQTPDEVVIVAHGPGVIRGTVLDADDRPAAGVALTISIPEVSGRGWMKHRHAPGGHAWVKATTDADGAFEVRGLRNASYHVDASVGSRFDDSAHRLTDAPLPADGRRHTLHLTRPHLAIHARDPDGTAVELSTLGNWRFDDRDEWPETAVLSVTHTAEHAHRGGWRGPSLAVKTTAPGEYVVELEHTGVAVDVGAYGGHAAWAPVRVDVPEDAGRVDVELVVAQSAPPGTLVLDVVDADGAALHRQLRVRVVDPVTSVAWIDRAFDYTDPDDWPIRLALPPGEHLLVVEGHPWIDDHHGTLMRRRTAGGFERRVTIASGVEHTLTAALDRPAHLEVTMIGSVDERDLDVLRERHGDRMDDEQRAHWASFVSLRLERPGRWPETPDFARHAMEGTTAAGTHMFSTVAFGETETSEPLTPGTYRLVATTAGERRVEREITLSPGATLPITLRFD